MHVFSFLIEQNRGINWGTKIDHEDMNAAIEATKMQFTDIIDQYFPFEQAESAIEHVWAGKQVGKVVISVVLS